LRFGEATPHRSSLCIARQRLGLAPLRRLFALIVRPLATPLTRGAFHRHLRLMAMDGTVLNVPDSEANAKAFGRCDGGRGASAFPQVRKLALVETGTHAEIAFVVRGVRGKGNGEVSMAPALFKHLQPGMLLLWDRGFFGFSLWKQARDRGADILGRVPKHAVLNSIKALRDGAHLAKIYPCTSMRNPDSIGTSWCV
jgi:Transposase DDE domain